MPDSWGPKARDELARRLRALGFADVTAWFDAHPGLPLRELADAIGAPSILIERAYLETAPDPARAAKDLLVRTYAAGRLSGHWKTAIAHALPHLEDRALRVHLAIRRRPADWRPVTIEDLDDLFAAAWRPVPLIGLRKARSIWPWPDDWRARLAGAVPDLDALFASAPTATSVELAATLDPAIEPVQLDRAYLEQATSPADLARRAREILARDLHANLTDGWSHADVDAQALTVEGWCGEIHMFGSVAAWDAARAVSAVICEPAFAPAGWRPVDAGDARLVRLFIDHWR